MIQPGDPVEAGGLGHQWHLLPGDVKLETARQLADKDKPAGSFRFIELFA